ncbi:MAG TPA: PilZ domain-containing protein [Solirubrobacteraceae bacterium]|nr:PilZ domain-containing protein [Solirubrobacteraceae bacterium]
MAPATATPQRRAAPRIAIELPLTFERAKRHGRPVAAHTLDLSRGGARVATERPLKVDEVLRFDLGCPDGAHVRGECRVLREHVGQCYAVRFERVDAGAEALERVTRA